MERPQDAVRTVRALRRARRTARWRATSDPTATDFGGVNALLARSGVECILIDRLAAAVHGSAYLDIDLLGEVTGGGTCEEILPHTQVLPLLGAALRCVSLPMPIRMKRAAGRVKDLDRLAGLEALPEERAARGEGWRATRRPGCRSASVAGSWSMRVLLQRVARAEVRIRPGGDALPSVSGRIGRGFLLLVGFTHTDTEAEVAWMADKVLGLRLFADADDKLNLSLADVQGGVLVVSQFTLYGDARKGRRPSFIDAARPETAIPLYDRFVALLRERGVPVATGEFGAMMDVELVNDGPVTLWLERDAAAPVSPTS